MENTLHCIAIDLGADSGRVMLCRWDGQQGIVRQLHRFPNRAYESGGHLFWDIEALWKGILDGLKIASRETDRRIDSIGIDGWAVDYVLLDALDRPIGPVYCYRDARNPPHMERAFSILPRRQVYEITGIQFLPFNTLYQLLAHRAEHPEHWKKTKVLLNVPEYFLFRLSGTPVSEYTTATHTQMVDVRTRDWSWEIAEAFDFDLRRFPAIVPPGTRLGRLRAELQDELGLSETNIIVPACHDTGSAVAGIPNLQDDCAFISSGTWSLVGTVLPKEVVSEKSFQLNFTNEGGVGNTIRFLKNVTGMWLLQRCLSEWQREDRELTLGELVEGCGDLSPAGPCFQIDERRFMAPDHMVSRINAALQENGFPTTQEPRELTRIILRSLARRYAQVIAEIEACTGKSLKKVCIIGGGVKNEPLNRLTARLSGLEVIRGPSESASGGNAAVQIAALEGDTSQGAITDIASRLAYRNG